MKQRPFEFALGLAAGSLFCDMLVFGKPIEACLLKTLIAFLIAWGLLSLWKRYF